MQTIRKGSRNVEAVTMLQELLREGGYDLAADGKFGPGTDRAVRDFQDEHGLVADGIVGEQTWMTLLATFPQYAEARATRFLSERDLERAARELDVELATVKAVTEVESSSHGFVGGKPKILFEGHVFWKRLRHHGLEPQDYRSGNEDILYPRWTREHYVGGVAEHERLDRARAIHAVAAPESASWGLFQIMGYHWEPLGYPSVRRFETLMSRDEGAQLQAFVRFVRVENLDGFLRDHAWAKFARRYNGSGYRENRYDSKLERAYRRALA